MNRVIDYLKGEPARVRLYGLAVLVLTYLGVRGVLTPADVNFYVAAAGVVLAVENVRGRVSPAAVVRLHPAASVDVTAAQVQPVVAAFLDGRSTE